MLLPNGSAIKNDVIEAFNRAIKQPENIEQGIGTTGFWDFGNADMHLDLKVWYNAQYIDECFDVLADDYEGVA